MNQVETQRRKETMKKEVSTTDTQEHCTSAQDSDSDDEAELLRAVTEWAHKDDDSHRDVLKEESTDNHDNSSPRTTWSLHVTQLSFDATDFDIREAFAKKGCLISSIRLVHDKNTTKFTGVAFVDFGNESSYKLGLTLNRTMLLGRRINVRPTKTKSELADIVQRRNVKIEAAKQQSISKEKKQKHNAPTDRVEKTNKTTKTTVKRKLHRKKMKSPNKKNTSVKLTKKERNRRAAIILSKKRQKK